MRKVPSLLLRAPTTAAVPPRVVPTLSPKARWLPVRTRAVVSSSGWETTDSWYVAYYQRGGSGARPRTGSNFSSTCAGNNPTRPTSTRIASIITSSNIPSTTSNTTSNSPIRNTSSITCFNIVKHIRSIFFSSYLSPSFSISSTPIINQNRLNF